MKLEDIKIGSKLKLEDIKSYLIWKDKNKIAALNNNDYEIEIFEIIYLENMIETCIIKFMLTIDNDIKGYFLDTEIGNMKWK